MIELRLSPEAIGAGEGFMAFWKERDRDVQKGFLPEIKIHLSRLKGGRKLKIADLSRDTGSAAAS